MISSTTRSRGQAGDNLLLLLGLPSTSRVLIVGEALRHWCDIFHNCRAYSSFAHGLTDESSCDLLLYHASCAADREQLQVQLTVLRRLLGTAGRLLMFAPNRYAFSRLKRIKDGAWRQKGSLCCSQHGYRQALRRAGFGRAVEYLALPSLDAAEEIVVPDSRFVELPRHWHPFLHLAHRFKLFSNLADGYLFFQGPESLDDGPLLSTISLRLEEKAGGALVRPSLLRFDLRLRGALVLFVSEQQRRCEVIARIVSDPEIDQIVRKNQKFLSALRAIEGLPESFRALLPEPLADFIFCDRSVYLETLKKGVPAWKVNRGSVRPYVFQEATHFLWCLQRVTCRPRQYDTETLRSLFVEDLEQLSGCQEVDENLRAGVERTLQSMCARIDGLNGFLVASHGDYGYGNLLVDADSGSLTGVIDWDTGRFDDLPGMDLLNLEVQRVRAELGAGVHDAFVAVTESVRARGGLDDAGRYAAEFQIEGPWLHALLHACLLRYLCRAAQYPEVFAAEQNDYQRTLDYLHRVAPL